MSEKKYKKAFKEIIIDLYTYDQEQFWTQICDFCNEKNVIKCQNGDKCIKQVRKYYLEKGGK